jgi:hypothetical protein
MCQGQTVISLDRDCNLSEASAAGHSGERFLRLVARDRGAHRQEIANPDLVAPLKIGAPRAEAYHEDLLGGCPKGCIDYPTLEENILSPGKSRG